MQGMAVNACSYHTVAAVHGIVDAVALLAASRAASVHSIAADPAVVAARAVVRSVQERQLLEQ